MMQRWVHYGTDNSRELVPGVLRGYRQFKYRQVGIERHSLLYSPQQQFRWDIDNTNTATCLCVRVTDASGPCSQCVNLIIGSVISADRIDINGLLRTLCGHQYPMVDDDGGMYLRRINDSRVKITYTPVHLNSPPDGNCGCGFYAAHTLNNLLNAPGIVWYQPHLTATMSHLTSVIGVVEAFGKVVVGTKGFRAEKMRVVALANYTPQDDRESLHQSNPEEKWMPLWQLMDKYPPDNLSSLGIPASEEISFDTVWHRHHAHWVV